MLLPLMKHFDNCQLILAGNNDTPYGRKIKEEINRLQLGDKIILPGKINESEKYWLYNNCRAFLFPSLAEGFGMPIVEAIKAGKPVFLSKYASLPEIGGDKAFYFNSFDEEDMSNFIRVKLNEFYDNHTVRKEELLLYSKLFDWEKCVTEYLDLYSNVASIHP